MLVSSKNGIVSRVCLTLALIGVLHMSGSCCSFRPREQAQLGDFRSLVIKDVAFSNASLPEVFQFVNTTIDVNGPHDRVPQFALSPDVGSPRIDFAVRRITLGEFMNILEQVADVSFIEPSRGRWVIVTHYGTE